MPFPKQEPRSYTKENVLNLREGQKGCYGLFVANQGWVYVGSGDIRQRLLDHLNGDNPCIARSRPSHWVDIVTADYINEEKRLILELNPSCNKKVG